MARPSLLIAVDQGTTGTRTYVFGPDGTVKGSAYREHAQHFPRPGWVEHDAAEIWDNVQATGRAALKSAGIRPGTVAKYAGALGITNQRETVLLWDRATARPLHRAIVWQCRRTAARCAQLEAEGWGPRVRRRTGLVLDAYFSATKAEWLLRHVPGARAAAARNSAALGTMDSYLLYRLTGGAVHATDYTNASRTLLFDIRRRRWDPALLELFGVPASLLPQARPSAWRYGATDASSFCGPGIPVTGIAGDQQAALFGQGCTRAGQMKNTYGTGCFLLMNLGGRHRLSRSGLLTTLACGPDGGPVFALEGAAFIGGAAVQWVRDQLGLVQDAAQTEAVCRSLPDNGGVHLVPAFVGLGAPHWDSSARGTLTGLTRGSTGPHVVRAAVESMAFQSAELVRAMEADAGLRIRRLRVDGGASGNSWLMQLQADLLGAVVERPAQVETTALGAALLAGLGSGILNAGRAGRGARIGRRFRPARGKAFRDQAMAGWARAVRQAMAA
jgi:glycerol kinase